MNDYYANGRPRWDNQFRETEWERNERLRKRRLAKRCFVCNGTGFASCERMNGRICSECRGSGECA